MLSNEACLEHIPKPEALADYTMNSFGVDGRTFGMQLEQQRLLTAGEVLHLEAMTSITDSEAVQHITRQFEQALRSLRNAKHEVFESARAVVETHQEEAKELQTSIAGYCRTCKKYLNQRAEKLKKNKGCSCPLMASEPSTSLRRDVRRAVR